MSDLIDKIKAQGEKLGEIMLLVDSNTYDRQLAPSWFYKLAIANVNVAVSDAYPKDSPDSIGCIVYEDNSVYWLKIW